MTRRLEEAIQQGYIVDTLRRSPSLHNAYWHHCHHANRPFISVQRVRRYVKLTIDLDPCDWLPDAATWSELVRRAKVAIQQTPNRRAWFVVGDEPHQWCQCTAYGILPEDALALAAWAWKQLEAHHTHVDWRNVTAENE